MFTLQNLKKMLFDPTTYLPAMTVLFMAELFVNVFVINNIKYTEIDWQAYMQEVEGVANGTFDYMQLKGDTGPLVYPAGFVYIYLALYYITDRGTNVQLAQYLFAVLYLVSLLVIFDIYRRAKKIPPYAYVFICCASYRIHSIYILRLFNDPVAMLFLYVAVDLILTGRWSWACLAYSLGVSVKMNLLLFAPGILFLLLYTQGIVGTLRHLTICAVPQIMLAIPFLLMNPIGYVLRAFDFGRKFRFKWTVNWRFLPKEIFLSSYFHISLLVAHVLVLICFAMWRWKKLYPGMSIKWTLKQPIRILHGDLILLPLFTANFIGMCFSRSLHYQFYVWYFHSLHFLLWSTALPVIVKILLLGVIELAWNTYPSTDFTSAALHCCHLVILVGLWASPNFNMFKKAEKKPSKSTGSGSVMARKME